jgi:hypothetical protein
MRPEFNAELYGLCRFGLLVAAQKALEGHHYRISANGLISGPNSFLVSPWLPDNRETPTEPLLHFSR